MHHLTLPALLAILLVAATTLAQDQITSFPILDFPYLYGPGDLDKLSVAASVVSVDAATTSMVMDCRRDAGFSTYMKCFRMLQPDVWGVAQISQSIWALAPSFRHFEQGYRCELTTPEPQATKAVCLLSSYYDSPHTRTTTLSGPEVSNMYLTVTITAGQYKLTPTATATPTPTIFMPLEADPQPVVASIISANSATTAFAGGCPYELDAASCGIPQVIATHISQSIWIATEFGFPGKASLSCEINTSATEMICTSTYPRRKMKSPGKITSTYTGTDLSSMFLPITITAGEEKLHPPYTTTPPSTISTTGTSTPTNTAPGPGTTTTAENTAQRSGSNLWGILYALLAWWL